MEGRRLLGEDGISFLGGPATEFHLQRPGPPPATDLAEKSGLQSAF